MATVTFVDSGPQGTFAPGASAITPVDGIANPAEQVVGVLSAGARLSLRIPPPAPAALDRITRRALSLAMPDPVIVNGFPMMPKYRAQLDVGGTALSGVGHMRGYVDNGLVHSGTGPLPGWVNGPFTYYDGTPPPAGKFIYWDVRDLPSPGSGRYLLGAADSRDGTAASDPATHQWSSGDGSDAGVNWNSAFPFKPAVQNHIHYALDGSSVTQTAGVHMLGSRVEHMWADFATILDHHWTALIVAIVADFPTKSFVNTIFDSGSDATGNLTAAQAASIYRNGLTGDIAVPSENLGYRNGLHVSRKLMSVFNDPNPTTRSIHVPYTHLAKPKVMAMVVNGSQSFAYIRDTSSQHVKHQTLAYLGPQRLWVMGRRHGIYSSLAAANMVVFEIRMWDQALTPDQLDYQYKQLSSSWEFDSYR